MAWIGALMLLMLGHGEWALLLAILTLILED